MNGKFLNYMKNYYRNINHLMNRINLEYNIETRGYYPNNINKNESEIYIKNKQKCTFCNNNQEVKYICPKCKIPYCSMECYKKHNEKCTEEFYKSNVIQELKNIKFNEEEKKNFREKLKNYNEKLNLIDEKYSQLKNEDNDENILNKKILHYEEILDKMNNDKFNSKLDFTADDWNDFHQFMKDFQKSEIFKIYKPFWLRESKSLLVFDKEYFDSLNEKDINSLKNLDLNSYYEFMNESNNEENVEEEEINDNINYIELKGEKILIDENIINNSIIYRYQQITKFNFTKANAKNIFQILYTSLCIVYIYRLFNGIVDDNDNIKDVYNHIIFICPILYDKKAPIPENVNNLFNIYCEKLKELEKNEENYNNIKLSALKDIIDLLKGKKFFIYESLLRLYDIIHKYSIRIDIENIDKTRTTSSKYKLIYFMSYLKYQVKENDLDDYMNSFIEILNKEK